MRNTIRALQYQLQQENVDPRVLHLAEELRQSIDYCLACAAVQVPGSSLPADPDARLVLIRDTILGVDDATK